MSYIVKSGQAWKVWVAAVLILLGGGAICFALTFSKSVSDATAGIAFLSGMIASIVGFAWGSLSVVCRSCGNRLVWQAMKEEHANAWLETIITRNSCKKCNHNFDI
jgi:hypothetical protein